MLNVQDTAYLAAGGSIRGLEGLTLDHCPHRLISICVPIGAVLAAGLKD